ncbi:aryl hydrocarbon receptor 1a isoform X2 [Scleropages formosus]|uniref:aryl hydrocarbon receptor 1a isoform X2 n=1 Tax=Scleropages formosus TaxID=113540 RepID=UPI0010FA9ED2|nr:aryl hydrocarbon receptor-like isoform X2 [Scleropages formosus]
MFCIKPTSAEGAKSNPSKRHRERLNGELERLASLLPFPQDVISKLDKLTVLRLSVSYLRARSFFSVTLPSDTCRSLDGRGPRQQGEELQEGELLLQLLNGFVLVVTASGTIFYVSPTIQDYLGFHQSDIIHQSAYDLIHAEDRVEFHRQLHWALNPTAGPEVGHGDSALSSLTLPLTCYNPEDLPPENSSFLERNFVCRLRCLLDSSSGFLAMNFQGRLKFLHGQNQKTEEGSPIPAQLALFAVVTPVQPPSILEIRTSSFFFKTKHKLDFTPTACDAKGKLVLGYTEKELCDRGTGYQFIHAADMLYCAENHVRMIKTGESGLTVFRLLSKQNRWLWVQANARLIYRNGKPDYIIATQKVLTEQEGEENLKKRNLKLPFSFTTGEAVLYDTALPRSLADSMSGSMAPSGVDSAPSKDMESVDPNSLLGAIMKQDDSIYVSVPGRNKVPMHGSELTGAMGGLSNVFTTEWVDSVLSLSKNSFFKQQQSKRFTEDKNTDLPSFMKTLEICREDLELSQQDEEFWKVNLHGNTDIMDAADEILSFVEGSLGKKLDCMFPNAPSKHVAPTRKHHQEPQDVPHQNQQQPLCELPRQRLNPPQQLSFVPQETEPGLSLHHKQQVLNSMVPQDQKSTLLLQAQQNLIHLHHHQQFPHERVLQNQESGLVSVGQQHLTHVNCQQKLPHQQVPHDQETLSLLQAQQNLTHLHHQQQVLHQQLGQTRESALLLGQQHHLTHVHHQEQLPHQQVGQVQECGSLLHRQQNLTHLLRQQPPQQDIPAQQNPHSEQAQLLMCKHHAQRGLQLEQATEQHPSLWDGVEIPVNGECSSLSHPVTAGDGSEHQPPLFHPDQPDRQHQSQALYGHFSLEGSTPGLHSMDQLNTISVTHTQCLPPCQLEDWLPPPQLAEPSAEPVADFTSLDLEELLENLDSGGLRGRSCVLSLQEGDGAPWCSKATRCLPHAHTSQMRQNQGLNPMLLSAVPSQGHLALFQNSSNGNRSMFYPESSGLTDFQQAGQPLHQHPSKSPLYPDPTLGGFTRA